ncbi:hypothetical protein [Clostridium sp.]|uniref:hypothetical protein n=1 Tax=Clostridium sp. TaxID=1506 RepID=UPI003993ABD9
MNNNKINKFILYKIIIYIDDFIANNLKSIRILFLYDSNASALKSKGILPGIDISNSTSSTKYLCCDKNNIVIPNNK